MPGGSLEQASLDGSRAGPENDAEGEEGSEKEGEEGGRKRRGALNAAAAPQFSSSHVFSVGESVSEEEVQRLLELRAQRLLLYDEDIVNLMEHMCSDVVTRVTQ